MLTKTLELKIFNNNNNHKSYVNGKDLCNFIGIKQPFEFTRNLRNFSNHDDISIISGYKTDSFRPEGESSRTIYYEIEELLRYLITFRDTQRHVSFDKQSINMVINEFKNIIKK